MFVESVVSTRLESVEQERYSVEFCVDCMYALEYGVPAALESAANAGYVIEADALPLARLAAVEGVALEGMSGRVAPDYDSDSGEGVSEFSTRFCDGCDTRYAGARFRHVIWY